MDAREIETISIIMPTYNRGYVIEKAIDSALRQSFREYELIIVDDGSSDHTFDIVKRYRDKRIKYYRLEENRGANYARNFGIRKAQGTYLAFLDSDNEWDKFFLEKRIGILKEQKAGLVFGRLVRLDENGPEVWPQNRAEEMSSKENIMKILFFGNLIDTNTVLMRHKYYTETGGFDENLKRFQDWDFFFRVLCRDEVKVYFSDDELVKSWMQPGSISKQPDLYWPSRIRIFQKQLCMCREKGYLYDIVYYMIHSSGEREVSAEIKKEILSVLDKEDLMEILPRLQESTLKDTVHKRNFQKNELIMKLLQKWLERTKTGWTVETQLQKYKMRRIMIYGFGILGKTLYRMLDGTQIETIYVVDQDVEKVRAEICEEKILEDLSQFRDTGQIDGIIVTAVFSLEEIRERIREYTETSILSIEDVLTGEVNL